MASWISLLDIVYPVGSLYMSTSSVSPASIVGGTWSTITAGACLGAAGTDFNVNNYNGSATISSSQIPAHKHGTGIDSMQFQICRNLASNTTGRRYFNTASGGTQLMISAQTTASDYDDYGLETMTGIAYTASNTGGGEAYYPKQYSVYMWVRTA